MVPLRVVGQSYSFDSNHGILLQRETIFLSSFGFLFWGCISYPSGCYGNNKGHWTFRLSYNLHINRSGLLIQIWFALLLKDTRYLQFFCHFLCNTGLPRLVSSANQYQSMPIKIMELIPMSINSDQFYIENLRGIDQHWSALRGISDRFHNFGIDRHWALNEGVLLLLIIIGYDKKINKKKQNNSSPISRWTKGCMRSHMCRC